MDSSEQVRQGGEKLPTVLVGKRNIPLHDDSLDMKCDAKEIPDPLESAASYAGKERLTLKDVVGAKSNQTRWIALGTFRGKARRAGAALLEQFSTKPGPIAMVVVESENRLLGILGPSDPNELAVWWAWPLADLRIQTAGVQGMFKKRPRQISISGFDAQLDLLEISFCRNDKSSFTMGRETAFLKALGAVSRA